MRSGCLGTEDAPEFQNHLYDFVTYKEAGTLIASLHRVVTSLNKGGKAELKLNATAQQALDYDSILAKAKDDTDEVHGGAIAVHSGR